MGARPPALRRLECLKSQGASAPTYYTPRAHVAAEADIFTANQTRRLLQSLRTELCILGYGRPRGRLNESGSELATVRCSKAELSALRRGAGSRAGSRAGDRAGRTTRAVGDFGAY